MSKAEILCVSKDGTRLEVVLTSADASDFKSKVIFDEIEKELKTVSFSIDVFNCSPARK